MERCAHFRSMAAVLMLIWPTCTFAESLTPLEELIGQGAEPTYPLVRCAGFYLSGLEWAGETRMGPEHSQKVKMTVHQIIQLATEMRSENLGADAKDSVYRDVRLISDLYLKRYEANYAATGQAFGNDRLWDSDASICRQLLEAGQ